MLAVLCIIVQTLPQKFQPDIFDIFVGISTRIKIHRRIFNHCSWHRRVVQKWWKFPRKYKQQRSVFELRCWTVVENKYRNVLKESQTNVCKQKQICISNTVKQVPAWIKTDTLPYVCLIVWCPVLRPLLVVYVTCSFSVYRDRFQHSFYFSL